MISSSFLIFLIFLQLTNGHDPIPKDGDKELKFVQIIWRHGDRSPTTTCSTDPTQEEKWTFGGGGWGQLSPLGMQMHVQFGRKLRRRYVESGYLQDRYKANEIYIRSTDVNRTLLSAVCNTIGMYGQNSAVKGEWDDIPQLTGNEDFIWPGSFVPIPIHTIDDDYDYWGNPDMICPRQLAVWKLITQGKEVTNLLGLNSTKMIFDLLQQNCNTTYDLTTLWKVADAFYIERLYQVPNPSWMTDSLFNQTFSLNNQAQDYVNGIGLSKVQGIDVSKEMRRIRAGSMINLINDQIKQKIDCIDDQPNCSKWMKNLKYFAYSAHDTTVYAYLTALNSEKMVIKDGGYPHYSAGVITEYWRDNNKNDFVKFIYHTGFGDNFTIFTPNVDGCKDFPIYCPLSNLDNLAKDLSSSKWGSPQAMCADTQIIQKTQSSSHNHALISSIFTLFLVFINKK